MCLCVDLNQCSAVKSGTLYACTRPMGHEGAHVACGSEHHLIAIWEQEK